MFCGFNGVVSRTGENQSAIKASRQRSASVANLLRADGNAGPVVGAPFTIAALPDTRELRQILPARIRVADAVDRDHAVAADNIAFATHFGDLVTRGYRDWHMDNADAAMDNLDGFVPYSVSMGNHDYEGYYEDIESHGTSANFAKYFGTTAILLTTGMAAVQSSQREPFPGL